MKHLELHKEICDYLLAHYGKREDAIFFLVVRPVDEPDKLYLSTNCTQDTIPEVFADNLRIIKQNKHHPTI